MNQFGKELKELLERENISIKEFASRINITPKNLIDILKGKTELSTNIIYNISFITDIPISYITNIEMDYQMNKKIKEYLLTENITIEDFINRFHYNNISIKKDNYNKMKAILKYLRITNPKTLYKNPNSLFYNNRVQKRELTALWLEKCYRLSKEQSVNKYQRKNIENIVKYITKCIKLNRFNTRELIKVFNEAGIYLIIENDFKETKVSSAIRINNNKPAIYIPPKKKAIDTYFSLLQALAHCKSDFNRAKSGSIIRYLKEKQLEDYEKNATKKAKEWMNL